MFADPGERLIIASMAFMAGDDETSMDLSVRLADNCRAQAMIGWLPHALQNLATSRLYLGRFQDAKASATEAVRIAGDTGQHHRVDHPHLRVPTAGHEMSVGKSGERFRP
ncbi:hypothetical protein [Nonomuraea polychroma]|uniref:hypothetical protein n=1 Tax=Nonomuraea polychroma TaxID=46176 RepID=UPI000FDCF966|nr:hypothetical protein [Nonomuraea polychroma]